MSLTHSPSTQNLTLIFGGVSPEHEVSIQSAATIAEAIFQLGGKRPLAVQPVYVNRDGEWVFGLAAGGSLPRRGDILAAEQWELRTKENGAEIMDFAKGLARLGEHPQTIALIIMHGQNGEDGRLQGALDLAGIRYTGSGARASAIAFDKPRCQAVLNAAGLPIAPSVVLSAHGLDAWERIAESPGLPCVIKPAQGGSSVGISIVRDTESLRPAIERALQIDDEVMAERFVQGREFTCGVIERNGSAVALPVTEIIPPPGRFFDYEAKYQAGLSREITPAHIPEELSRRIQGLAIRAHESLGCRGFSRTDFIAEPTPPIILEVNTIPGFTATSLLPQGAAAAGIDLPSLVGLILDSAARD